LTGELKAKRISELQVYVKGFQERRAKVTDEIVHDFMSRKKLEWKGNPDAKIVPKEGESTISASGEAAEVALKLTKNQEKKLAKQKMIDEKVAAKGQ